MAVPAKRVKKTITLADGTTREVTLQGNENAHYYVTADGVMYRKNAEGVYAELTAEALKAKMRTRPKANANKVKRRATWGLEQQNIRGEKKGLVILVSFSDLEMTHTQSDFNDYFNKEGYNTSGMGGSVRDYFLAQSYGLLTIDFDVVGPVTVSKKMSYYGGNDSDGNDNHPAEMVCEAIKAVKDMVDFSDYDWDGDGEVDQVYVIYAGYGEAQGGGDDTIWPHEWELSSANYYGDGDGSLILDGVTINTYACSNELYGTSGTQMDGVGTACHEFSHCLGLPDFYDTSGGSNFGMDYWSIMDYGCYAGNGFVPCGYTSYERMYAGWMTPIELTSYTEVTDMPALNTDSVAYIIRNGKKSSEYYLLENRQKQAWDKYIPAAGLLILHVDFDKNTWVNNAVNNTSSHQRMTIIPADGTLTSSTTTGDTWPRSGKTELTNTSTPAATLYNANTDGKKFMNFPIVDITKNTSKKTISFVAGNYEIATPVATEATNVTDSSFTANWEAMDDATNYEIVLTQTDPSATTTETTTLLSEDFSGFKASTAGSTDISSSLSSYTQTEGWSGTKLYLTTTDEVKLGSGKANGSITTPTIDAPGSGLVNVAVTCRYYSSSSANDLTVMCNGTQIGTITPTAENETTTFTVEVSGSFYITVTASPRAYLDAIEITSDAGGVSKTVVTTSANYYNFTGLDPNYAYSYVVYAYHDEVKSEESNSISVDLDGGYDGITSIKSNTNSGVAYDLSGRRHRGPLERGIYIVNGNKVLVK